MQVYPKIGGMSITQSIRLRFFLFTASLLTSACTVDKLEARLQADPQCKSVINQKTGALMPCPGTDKTFYRSIPALSTVAAKLDQTPELATTAATVQAVNPTTTIAPTECKPQLHQKSGSLMPCPSL